MAHDRETYIDVFEHQLLPRALAYRPDCVLISAGFDAHYADPLAHMQVTEAGYRRMTQVVKEIAATCCEQRLIEMATAFFDFAEQRLIAVLEGGYNLDALGRSVEAHVEELQRDA
jgi:acetoin utilization deacetylase AcuC-like enzyme